eukprot:Plantae.Rhodophyta-Hildenbrandia_rubra.ctg18020.p1 GENE.Plantae.Rhodophyta-Hildenbrandia_rubra.ctg18020~~Plantae.Rhodophyta-Hildenbrandia_rubra.ctg18020.p1  ORF type:complete len:648 (-),score=93.42 Plantae.Rhodophyta-Hildenbrandia_rubra.ctg18020:539-2482(-)
MSTAGTSTPSRQRQTPSQTTPDILPDLSAYLERATENPPSLSTARSSSLVAFLSLLVFSLSIALWSSRGHTLRCPDCNCGASLVEGPAKSVEGAESSLGAGLSVFAATLVLCVLASYVMQRWDFAALPDCIAYVLFGALVGSVLRLTNSGPSAALVLPNQEQFFIFILPPIMFEAGYSLNKKDFFREAGSILTFAIPGTIISALVFGAGIFVVGLTGASYSFGFWEAMTFGALLSAVDPVATIAVFSALKVNKPLHFLVFGESVLNDAVAIVLYRSFSTMILVQAASGSWLLPITNFLKIFLGSTIIGILSGFLTAFVLKHTKLYTIPQLEITFFFLMAYLPYFVCDGLSLSGIMGILSNGATLAHYAHHNLSKVTQVSAQQSFRMLSFLAETFVFVFLGSALTTFNHEWHGLTIFWAIIFTLVSRLANIYPLANLVNRYREEKITAKNQLIMWFSGLRGAVAFALSLNFPAVNGSDDTRRVVISSTLAVVLFTVIVLGGGTLPLLRLLRVEGAANDPVSHPMHIDRSFTRRPSDPEQDEDGNPSPTSFLGRVDNWLKPVLLAPGERSMAATNRTLQALAVADGMTPHELGTVLENTASAIVPEINTSDVETGDVQRQVNGVHGADTFEIGEEENEQLLDGQGDQKL